MVKKPSPIEKVAYHEAGHAVAAYIFHRRFSSVSIIPKDDYLGIMTRPKTESLEQDLLDMDDFRNRKRIESEIIISFAGAVAEGLLVGRHNWKGAIQDNHQAIDSAEAIVSSHDELEAYINWLWLRTRNLLSLPVYWAAVQALAEELIICKEIKTRKARRIIAGAILARQPDHHEAHQTAQERCK